MPDTSVIGSHPFIRWEQQQQQIAWADYQLQRARVLPQLSLGYHNQSITGFQNVNGDERFYDRTDRFNSISAGLSIPVFIGSLRSGISASRLNFQVKQQEFLDATIRQRSALQQLRTNYEKNRKILEYYETSGLRHSKTLTESAARQFNAGAISYLEWMMLVNQSLNIHSEYLNAVSEWNEIIIELNAYTENQK